MDQSHLNESILSCVSTFGQPSNESDFENGGLRKICFCLTSYAQRENKLLLQAIEGLGALHRPVNSTEELHNLIRSDEYRHFVCDNFSGEPFSLLCKSKRKVFGVPALISLFQNGKRIPKLLRPLYSNSLVGVILCFTGFRQKEELNRLCNLVHHMGGSVRKDFSGKITHLVAHSVQGQKYKAAVSLGTHIVTEQWLHYCWKMRDDVQFKGTDEGSMEKYKMPPFIGLTLSFLGFPEEERLHMEETCVQNGGKFAALGSKDCTHLVVEENGLPELPDEHSYKDVFIVKQEWFWASIQIDACADESLYLFTNENIPASLADSQKGKKRKRLKNTDLSDLFSPDSPLFSSKRRSKDRLSAISIGTLDSSIGSPLAPDISQDGDSSVIFTPPKKHSARYQTVSELLQTERNYVEILSTIIKVFKEPIEQSVEQRGGALLAPEEIKTIFGSVPEILEVHESLLNSLEGLISNWTESRLVGKIIVDHAEAMAKAYPHFVNYFEMTKETVVRCDRERPRFHAFLKICMTKPQCGRQSLTELLIRPVQRIPSMNLLLNDILKHTPTSNPDHNELNNAVQSLKQVLTYINEDKRRTEGQVQMFEILRDVEDCPAYVLSSHRSLITRSDMIELSEIISEKGMSLTMFLFTDSIEVTKKRNVKVNHNGMPLKSPARTPQRMYKHIEFIPLSHIKTVVDITDSDEHKNLFALIYRSPTDACERLLIFKLLGETEKNSWIRQLSKILADSKCMADSESFITTVEPHELMLKKFDVTDGPSGGTLSRAFRKAKKTTKKVGRAFSLSRTPKTPISVRRAFSSLTPNTMRHGSSPTPSEIMEYSICEEANSSFRF